MYEYYTCILSGKLGSAWQYMHHLKIIYTTGENLKKGQTTSCSGGGKGVSGASRPV